jgi:phage-related protein
MINTLMAARRGRKLIFQRWLDKVNFENVRMLALLKE